MYRNYKSNAHAWDFVATMKRFLKNPFPGMNPWLEGYWGDVHTKLTTYAYDEANG